MTIHTQDIRKRPDKIESFLIFVRYFLFNLFSDTIDPNKDFELTRPRAVETRRDRRVNRIQIDCRRQSHMLHAYTLVSVCKRRKKSWSVSESPTISVG